MLTKEEGGKKEEQVIVKELGDEESHVTDRDSTEGQDTADLGDQKEDKQSSDPSAEGENVEDTDECKCPITTRIIY